MTNPIRAIENKEFSERHAESGKKLYRVEVPEATLGLFFTTPSTRALVWNGALDFSELDHEVLESLTVRLSEGLSYEDSTDLSDEDEDNEQSEPFAELSIKVTFISSYEEIMEYRLDSNRQYRQYKQAIENPDQITCARYDLYDRPRPFHKYAFTAENFRLLDADQGELAVKLPADRPWSFQLVEWISQHHSAARKLLEEIDLESVAHVLSTTGGEHGTQAVS